MYDHFEDMYFICILYASIYIFSTFYTHLYVSDNADFLGFSQSIEFVKNAKHPGAGLQADTLCWSERSDEIG